ncbi:MAG: hypothetical protein QXM43_09445, partial [Desulfurococcaceae archaeon]
ILLCHVNYVLFFGVNTYKLLFPAREILVNILVPFSAQYLLDEDMSGGFTKSCVPLTVKVMIIRMKMKNLVALPIIK